MSAAKEPTRGRPERRRRQRVLRTRVDDVELAIVQRFAGLIGASISSYLRDAALRRPTVAYTTPIQSKVISDLSSVVGSLSRLGLRLTEPANQAELKRIMGLLAAISDYITQDGL